MNQDAAMDTTARLAAAVAEAADAWLKDPRDVNVYQRLVEATMRWRAHAQPQLESAADEPALQLEPPDLAADDGPDVDLDLPMPGTLADGIRDLTARLKP
jgi:hypothetical protein